MKISRRRKICLIAGLYLVTTSCANVYATNIFYNDQGTFFANLGTSITDDYSNPGYSFIQDDNTMSSVLGETMYTTTGFPNLDIVSSEQYCAGCNGSFELDFTSTSVGNSSGVYGVGLNIPLHNQSTPYFAYITYASGATEDLALSLAGSYWGVTSDDLVTKIHFGLSGGGTTTSGSFAIDDLTIGSIKSSNVVPEPATMLLFGTGIAGLAALGRRRKK